MNFLKLKNSVFLVLILIFPLRLLAQSENAIVCRKLEYQKAHQYHLLLPQKIKRKKVGLALSGGGARGFTQIGILKVLEKEKIPMDFIAGTSMGGIIGGLFACGYSAQELEELALNTDWMDLISDTPARLSLLLTQREEREKSFVKLRFDGFKPYIPQALTSGQKISNLLTNLTMRANFLARSDFDRLKIPFRSVTTDLVSGKEVVLGSGDLAEALRATMAVPLAFTPVEKEGMLLVDGGLVDPIPVEVVKEMGAEVIIAVNTSADLLPKEKIDTPLDIADQTTTIMSLNKKTEQLNSADVIISPDLIKYSAVDFSHIPELIVIGEDIAQRKILQIKRLLQTEKKAEENKIYPIEKIEFTGNRYISKEFLKGVINATSPAQLSFAQIENDVENLLLTGHFSEICAELAPGSDLYILSYRLNENPKVNKIKFLNNTLFPDSVLKEKISLEPGQIINHQILSQDLKSIVELYHKNDYSLADIEKIDYDSASCKLSIKMDEGIIQRIEIKGNHRTRDWIIRMNFPQKERRPFNQRKVDKGLRNIYNTGFFETVVLNLYSTPQGNVLQIKVKEKKFGFVRLGAHWNDEYHTEGFAELVDENVFGTGNEVYTHFQYGHRKQIYSLNFKADRIFKTYLTYKLKLYHTRDKRYLYDQHKKSGSFDQKRTGATFSLGQHIKRLGTLSIEGRMEKVYLKQNTEQKWGETHIRSVTFRSLVDTFNKFPFPDYGKYHLFYLELASDVLGGEVVYKKAGSSIESYFPLGKRLNFHPKVAFGYSDKGLPLSEKFTLGGKNNFFGLHSEELKGDKMILLNLGLRVNFLKKFYLTLRYDWGDAWSKLREIKWEKMEQGIGVGLSLATPLGPIEFFYGKAKGKEEKIYLQAGLEF
jgi:NTE family protein